jgi:PIN domain
VAEAVYLIDHENLSKVDLTHVPDGARAILFLGANHASVNRTLFTGAVKLGERLKLVEIEGSGKNALDFHIAFYLGQLLTRNPDLKCVVLSKDKGFAPLVKHLAACGFNVEQADALATGKVADAKSEPAADSHYARVIKVLKKQDKRALPHTLEKLQKHVANMVKGRGVDDQVPKFVKRLFKDGLVMEQGKVLAYPGRDG